MFFILSKVLDFLISPIVWIILLFLFAFFSRNRKAFAYALVVLIVFSNGFIVSKAFHAWEGKPITLNPGKQYQTAIVLTGFTNVHKETPGRVYFGRGSDRLLHTVELYKSGKVKTILVTGGSGSLANRQLSEADQVKRALLYCGVPDSAIMTEERSSNTVENARLSKKFIDSLALRGDFLLVTSAFHVRRAAGCFKKAGVQFDAFPVDFYTRSGERNLADYLLPSEAALEQWSVLIHEITGYVVYKIMGYS